MRIWCDGATRGNGTTTALSSSRFVTESGIERTFALPLGCSINIAELVAIRNALRFAAVKELRPVDILTDSQVAIGWLKKGPGMNVASRSRAFLATALPEMRELLKKVDGKVIWIDRKLNRADLSKEKTLEGVVTDVHFGGPARILTSSKNAADGLLAPSPVIPRAGLEDISIDWYPPRESKTWKMEMFSVSGAASLKDLEKICNTVLEASQRLRARGVNQEDLFTDVFMDSESKQLRFRVHNHIDEFQEDLNPTEQEIKSCSTAPN